MLMQGLFEKNNIKIIIRRVKKIPAGFGPYKNPKKINILTV